MKKYMRIKPNASFDVDFILFFFINLQLKYCLYFLERSTLFYMSVYVYDRLKIEWLSAVLYKQYIILIFIVYKKFQMPHPQA